MNTLDTVLLLAISAIRDEFDFGAKRLQRLIDQMEKKASCLIGDMVTWEDFRKQMAEETGIEINVREESGRIRMTK